MNPFHLALAGVGLIAFSFGAAFIYSLCRMAKDSDQRLVMPKQLLPDQKRKAWTGRIDYTLVNKDAVTRSERMRMH